jgi:hypothetical protein
MAKADAPVVTFDDDDEPDEQPVAEDDIEIVAGDPNAPPAAESKKSYEDLVAEIQAERAAKEALAARVDPVAALQSTLKEALAGREATPATPQQAPGENDEDFSKRLKESFFEDPVSHLDKWGMRKLAPILNQQASMTQALLRRDIERDPKWGGTYSRYKGEVDKIVASRGDRYTNPDIYQEAVRSIAASHIDELVAEAVAKATAPKSASTPAPAYSEATARPRAAGPRQVVMTEADIKWARDNGVDPKDYYRSKYGR